ncbi:MAG: lipopolysaccharide biosynthesis protein [Tannerellaceae bacterium]|jgi:O-antigen/teichoic acid export membrane protein|nr:lipopolysaccharide biosynthesis protein [Tannerellaceae bacterium]
MSEETLKEKTAKGLFWGGISNGGQQLLGVVFGIFLARILNAEDYGLVGMLAIFTGIAGTIINSGFSVALTNKQNATHEDYNAVFWFTFFAGLILYIILFFSAPFIARFFGRPELISLSRVVFISFFISGIATVPYTVLFKQLLAKRQAIIDLSSILLSGCVGLIFALKGHAYWALAIQNVVFVSSFSILRCIFSPWRPTLKINFKPLKEMLPFSIKLFITGIFSQISNNIFSVLIGKFYHATQLGYYDQGRKWMGMGQTFIGNMINTVSQPVLVQVHENKERQVAVLRKLIRFGAFVSFPLMLGLAFVGREFIVIAIGEEWLPSVPFLQLFCIWGAFVFLWNLLTNLIYTHGKSNTYMYVMILTGVLQLGVAVGMSPWGIYPMIIAYLLTYFIGLIIWQQCAYKLVGLRLRDILRDILPYLIITTGCFFIAWLLTWNIQNVYLLFILKVIITVILYVFIMKFSRSTIFKESMEYLINILTKKQR